MEVSSALTTLASCFINGIIYMFTVYKPINWIIQSSDFQGKHLKFIIRHYDLRYCAKVVRGEETNSKLPVVL